MEDFIPENLKNSVPQSIPEMPTSEWKKPIPNKNEKMCVRCNTIQIPQVVYNTNVTLEYDVSATQWWQLAVVILACCTYGLGLLLFLFFGLKCYKNVHTQCETYKCGFCGSKELRKTPEQKEYDRHLYEYERYNQALSDYYHDIKQRKGGTGKLPQKSFMELYFNSFPNITLPKWFKDLSIGEKLVVSLTIVAIAVGVVCLFMLF